MEEIKILYKDEDVVVCIKPVGLSSESTDNKDGLCDLLALQLGKKEVYTLHRLDVGVGGLMAYALNKKSAAILSKDIAEGDFHKYYTADVYGCPQENEGVFEDLLFKDSKKNKSFVVNKERKGVKKAKLAYKVIESRKDGDKQITTVEVYLYTGRSHQIRVQFSHRGMPLLGDGKYGAKDNQKQISLCCTRLVFNRPSDNERLTFEIPYGI
ncbi:MAG: RluA family pseudouridine synthase [Clostridia bacterium]|nr:RluA family pseudouridine synthase [Clostridia bacterium]